ncbi:hypothetical protein C8A03DRAFT_39031 [Achaetomium macrosporum]|uniref:Uncharacterized protein n=1 Tax=Achaetomium macrosporum TaxID=79813 RepID=A0AAN7C2E5_9PEZI|nr:hypothetical protein C8A03DRAFT_39031 [Achaetomium macrosporum]
MPELHEVSYSREATIAAVREYYRFLTRMYLKECYVAEPPEGGWPEINADTVGVLGKTDEVISLLRHPPYIHSSDDSAQGAGMCLFADWRSGSVAWAIPDFFELLKDLFRQLFYIPISPRKVYFARTTGRMRMVAAIYRAHGWPDLERYRKQDCLKAVQALMEERYSDYADRREKDE